MSVPEFAILMKNHDREMENDFMENDLMENDFHGKWFSWKMKN
jgi:hypothetical protein